MLAPARTPQHVVTRLSEAIAEATRHAEVVQRFTALGIDPVGSTPEAYVAQTRIDIAKYAKAVKAAGLKAE